MLTNKQHEILQAAIDGHNILMTGPGGTGKSFVIKHIKTALEDEEKNVTITAMTGAAAVLISGRTLHSTLGIGLGKANVKTLLNKTNAKLWRDIDVLIIDEISMLSDVLLDKIEELARHCRKNRSPFGKIQLILSGDFLQLPTIQDDFCFKASCWEKLKLKVFVMSEIQRQSEIAFQHVLNKARFGNINKEDILYLTSGGSAASKEGVIPTKILCKNVDVDAINKREFDKLCASTINEYTKKVEIYDTEYIDFNAQSICNAPDHITLAVGAQVMMLINTHNVLNLVNGSRGVVTSFDENKLPMVKFVCDDREIKIDYHEWSIEVTQKINDDCSNLDDVREKYRTKVVGKVRAMPLRLAWAVTCHKAQGVSIDSAYIDLAGVFTEGQAYVAISRVRSHDALILKNATPKCFKANKAALKYYETLKSTC
jgi:ATP-dependent DNA helicase PIF1